MRLDRIMEWLTARRMKLAGSGHPPDDAQPETGSGELSEELEADYGPETTAAEPPPDAGGAGPTRSA